MSIKPTAHQTFFDKIGYETYHVNFPQEDDSVRTYRTGFTSYNANVLNLKWQSFL